MVIYQKRLLKEMYLPVCFIQKIETVDQAV